MSGPTFDLVICSPAATCSIRLFKKFMLSSTDCQNSSTKWSMVACLSLPHSLRATSNLQRLHSHCGTREPAFNLHLVAHPLEGPLTTDDNLPKASVNKTHKQRRANRQNKYRGMARAAMHFKLCLSPLREWVDRCASRPMKWLNKTFAT